MFTFSYFFLFLFSSGDWRLPLDKIEIFAPPPFAVNTSGVLCVGDNRQGRLHFLESNGNLLKTSGRKGEGPGEFQGVHKVYWSGSERVFIVYDSNRSRISGWRPDGTFTIDVKVPAAPMITPYFPDLQTGFFFSSGELPALYRLALPDKGEKELFQVPGFKSIRSLKIPQGEHFMEMFYLWDPKIILRGHGEQTIVSHNVTNRIHLLNTDGSNVVIDVPMKAVPVTSTDIEACLARLPDHFREGASKHLKNPDFWPIIENILLDGQGRIWVFGHPAPTKPIPFFRYMPSGKYDTRGFVPQVPEVVTKEHFYYTDELNETVFLVKSVQKFDPG